MLGDRIRQLRVERGLSMSELAERAGVAKSYLSAIERYIQVNPSIQVLEKLAGVFDVPVHSIIESEDVVAADGTPIDPEWVEIAREAMDSGITKDQFREFLEFQKWRHKSLDDLS